MPSSHKDDVQPDAHWDSWYIEIPLHRFIFVDKVNTADYRQVIRSQQLLAASYTYAMSLASSSFNKTGG